MVDKRTTDLSVMSEEERKLLGVTDCKSVLVCTGVFNEGNQHNHRDFIMDSDLRKPTKMVPDVYEAVKEIFTTESIAGFS